MVKVTQKFLQCIQVLYPVLLVAVHYLKLFLDASVSEFSGYYWNYYEFLDLFPCFSESMFTKLEGVRKGSFNRKNKL